MSRLYAYKNCTVANMSVDADSTAFVFLVRYCDSYR